LADIINIGEIRVKRIIKEGLCPHKQLVYDYRNEYIQCEDCGLPVQPFQAFMMLVNHFDSAISRLEHRRKELSELEAASNRNLLKAVKEIDRIWRRKMLPCCPHCGRGIAIEDGLGNSCISAQVETERRRFQKDQNQK
jgi:hypothetical protein